MGDTLNDAHLGLGLVVHGPEGEGHHAELLGGLREELPRVLHLEHVRLVGLLVDGDLGVALAALALAGGDQHVDAVHLEDEEQVRLGKRYRNRFKIRSVRFLYSP